MRTESASLTGGSEKKLGTAALPCSDHENRVDFWSGGGFESASFSGHFLVISSQINGVFRSFCFVRFRYSSLLVS